MTRDHRDWLFGTFTTGPLGDAGMMLLRVYAGLALAFQHGRGKIPPSEGFQGMVGGLGFPAPELFAWMAGLAEFGGGILLALGLLTRPVAAILVLHFLVVAFLAHAGDPFARRELPLFFLFTALMFTLTGAGRYALDALIRGRRMRSSMMHAAVVALAGVALSLPCRALEAQTVGGHGTWFGAGLGAASAGIGFGLDGAHVREGTLYQGRFAGYGGSLEGDYALEWAALYGRLWRARANRFTVAAGIAHVSGEHADGEEYATIGIPLEAQILRGRGLALAVAAHANLNRERPWVGAQLSVKVGAIP
jgi:putative oxidoreductase